MVVHNPPKHDPDMPHHEHYATEGKTKMYRPKSYHGSYEENVKEHGKKKADDIGTARINLYIGHHNRTNMKEHQLPYWEGSDHS